jgi:hypothetical protein
MEQYIGYSRLPRHILKHQLRWYKGVQHVLQAQLPQTAAVVLLPLPLHVAKALLQQNPFAQFMSVPSATKYNN